MRELTFGGGGIFPDGENEKIFGYWGDSSSYPPSRENPERGERYLTKKMKRENRWCQKKFIYKTD